MSPLGSLALDRLLSLNELALGFDEGNGGPRVDEFMVTAALETKH